MAYIILPHRWNRQPTGPVELDRGNLFAQRVQWFIVPAIDAGNLTRVSRASIVSSDRWLAVTGNSSGYWIKRGLSLANAPGATLAGRVRFNGSADTGVGGWGTETQGYGATLRFSRSYTTNVAFGGGNPTQSFGCGYDHVSNIERWMDLCGVTNGTNDHKLFIDGVVRATSSSAFTLTSDHNLGLLFNTSGGDAALDGPLGSAVSVEYLYGFPLPLSSAEVEELRSRPYQLFRPLQRRIYVGPSAGGGEVRYGRPISDISAGGWLPSTGSDLFATIDEEIPDDADYNYTTTSSTFEVALTPLEDPLRSTDHRIKFRVPDGFTPIGNLRVTLRQGSTEIAEAYDNVVTDDTSYTYLLTESEANSITDYTDLKLRFESS